MHKNRAGALRPRHDLIICVFVSTPTIDREPLFFVCLCFRIDDELRLFFAHVLRVHITITLN